jgi:hypothetical protein
MFTLDPSERAIERMFTATAFGAKPVAGGESFSAHLERAPVASPTSAAGHGAVAIDAGAPIMVDGDGADRLAVAAKQPETPTNPQTGPKPRWGARPLTPEELAQFDRDLNGPEAFRRERETAGDQEGGLWGEEGFTFQDFLSIINPLQHIPIISVFYRELTGDSIKPGARLMGGALFGGPLGLFAGAMDAAVERGTGKDIGGALLAMVRGEELVPPARAVTEAVASTATPAVEPPAAAVANIPAIAATPASAVVPAAKSGVGFAPGALVPARLQAPATPASGAPQLVVPGTAAAEVAGALAQVPSSVATTAVAGPASTALVASATAARNGQTPAAAGDGIALPGTREFAAPQRLNNIQPRMPVPNNRVEVLRAREFAPQQVQSARADVARPDRSPAPATILGSGREVVATPSPPTVTVEPPTVPGAVPNLPDAMTRALDKYEALVRSRRGGGIDQRS